MVKEKEEIKTRINGYWYEIKVEERRKNPVEVKLVAHPIAYGAGGITSEMHSSISKQTNKVAKFLREIEEEIKKRYN